MKVPVSVLIPIKNEADNLPRCLNSISWAEEIFVVDSQSSDASAQIAQNFGAKVVQFQFNGTWPKKKNWALENLPFSHRWVLILDADEVLAPAAQAEILAIVQQPEPPLAGYWINRRFMFMGRWLKHAYYPNWNLRLFQHALGRHEKLTGADTQSGDNEVHEHVVVQGPTGRLHAQIDHYAFPSVEVFVEKHNRYSNWEARVAHEASQNPQNSQNSENLQNRAVGTRRWLKNLSRKLPCRGWLRFCYIYFWQAGFLDGREGYYFARLHAMYELLNSAKTFELRKKQRPGKRSGIALRPVLITLAILSLLLLTLAPNLHGNRLPTVPIELRRWIDSHDNLANFLAFCALGLLVLGLSRARGAGLLSLKVLAGLLLALVCSIELIQLAIPGRVCDPKDIATGAAGIVAAFFFHRWRLPPPSSSSAHPSRILGLQFFSGTETQLLQRALEGGLIVVPSAPVLVALVEDPPTRDALLDADLILPDSGFMVLLWRLLKDRSFPRISGLFYLKILLHHLRTAPSESVLWVMPSLQTMERALFWLASQGHKTTRAQCYLAPVYSSPADPDLLALILEQKPRHVIMAIGGGTQEKLGHYLKRNLPPEHLVSIHCTGAAIGFLCGDQATIPPWADRFFLGWLLRCFSQPMRFIPRYWRAKKLAFLLLKYQDRLPNLQA